MNPDHHRAPLAIRSGRGPDVEIQAVLARFRDCARALCAGKRERGSLLDAAPGNDGSWHLPTQIANGRRGERNTLEGSDTVINDAPHRAASDVRLRDCRRGGPDEADA